MPGASNAFHCKFLFYFGSVLFIFTAKQLISLIADVVKTSPPTNRFMVMIETNKLDYFMAGMIEQFASVWSGEFITAGGDCVAVSMAFMAVLTTFQLCNY